MNHFELAAEILRVRKLEAEALALLKHNMNTWEWVQVQMCLACIRVRKKRLLKAAGFRTDDRT